MTHYDDDDFDDVEQDDDPRPLWSTMWFRGVLVLGGVLLVAFLAVPALTGGGGDSDSPSQLHAIADGASPNTLETPTLQGSLTEPGAAKPEEQVASDVRADQAAAPSGDASPSPVSTLAETATPAPEPEVTTQPRRMPTTKAASNGTAAVSRKSTGRYWVQIGSFRDNAAASRLAAQLREKDLAATVSTATPAGRNVQWSRVRVGPFSTRAAAKAAGRNLEAAGYSTLVVRGS